MKVHIEVQCAAEALDQRDRTALRLTLSEPGLANPKSADRAVHDPQRLAHRCRIAGKQKASCKGYPQHPLTHRRLRQPLIDQKRGTLHHASGATSPKQQNRPCAARIDRSPGLTRCSLAQLHAFGHR